MSCSSDKSGDSATRLAALREEIDAVDDALHDLLMRRAELTRNMGILKTPAGNGAVAANPVRPAREAAILRRLAARHRDVPPFAVIVRIWRELIAANLRRQCAFRLAVAECGDGRLQELARAEFGALTPADPCFRPEEVVSAVSAAPGTLGIFPAPADAPPEWQFWPELLTAASAPRILCALPALAESAPPAFAVGHASAEPSGDDVSYVLLTGCAPPEPQAPELAAAGLTGYIEAQWPAMITLGLYCGFAAVQGFVTAPQIDALDALRRRSGGAAVLVGAAPAPIRPPGSGRELEEDGP